MIYLDTSALVKKYVIEEGTVEVREEIFPLIHKLTQTHPLRGADAVHLSSALWVGEEIGQSLRFVASDGLLLRAAEKEGLEVINPGKA